MAEASSISRSSVLAGHHRKISPAEFISTLNPEYFSCLAAQTRLGTACPVSTVRTCTPAGEDHQQGKTIKGVPGGMEQGILHVQPGQVGAAPDEVPFAPEAGEPFPQVIGGISPDRRVAVQSERLAEDLDGQQLNVRQRRRRAAQTGLAEDLSQDRKSTR